MEQEMILNATFTDAEEFHKPSVRRTLNWLKKFRDRSVDDLSDEALRRAQKVDVYLAMTEIRIDFNNIMDTVDKTAPLQKRAQLTKLAVILAVIYVKENGIWPKLRKFKKAFYSKKNTIAKAI